MRYWGRQSFFGARFQRRLRLVDYQEMFSEEGWRLAGEGARPTQTNLQRAHI